MKYLVSSSVLALVFALALHGAQANEPKSLVESEEVHASSADPSAKASDRGTAETVTVAGRPILTERSAHGEGAGRTTVWRSSSVPFSGLVKSTSGDVEQVLVAFNRAP